MEGGGGLKKKECRLRRCHLDSERLFPVVVFTLLSDSELPCDVSTQESSQLSAEFVLYVCICLCLHAFLFCVYLYVFVFFCEFIHSFID